MIQKRDKQFQSSINTETGSIPAGMFWEYVYSEKQWKEQQLVLLDLFQSSSPANRLIDDLVKIVADYALCRIDAGSCPRGEPGCQGPDGSSNYLWVRPQEQRRWTRTQEQRRKIKAVPARHNKWERRSHHQHNQLKNR
jgi:hypothetical protein